MSRIDELKRFTDKGRLGIEIAPFYRPIVRKSDGYNILVLDIFDTDELKKIAVERHNVAECDLHLIEDVDIVSNATDLGDAVAAQNLEGQVDYILSSHNFEHLPDPIKFLQACSKALRPGGTISMAIPDHRMCFDHFRTPTKLSDWLAAFHNRHTQPTPETIFDYDANIGNYYIGEKRLVGMSDPRENPDGFWPKGDLKSIYATYVADVASPSPYRDVHCNVVFGASLELMIRDLRHIGLIDLDIIEVLPPQGLEFFIHLRKADGDVEDQDTDEDFNRRRLGLLREVNASLGSAGLKRLGDAMPKPVPVTEDFNQSGSFSLRKIVRTIIGDGLYEKLKAVRNRMIPN
ncbi:methyltransferase domain-containing protein [Aliiroseovarius sp. 2305UL8-7]|uniref:methyltransferase domain-containing protein n=1 Tax=Aliiroseovarius conchicola TaxID=3121637 RepID=UPI0035278370